MSADINPISMAIFGGLGVPELIVIFFIVLILFGANKLPKIAKDIGSGIREFKKSVSGESEENKNKNDGTNT